MNIGHFWIQVSHIILVVCHFFEKEKLFIISRTTDKLLGIIEEILEKKIEDTKIVLNSPILEKKSLWFSKARFFLKYTRDSGVFLGIGDFHENPENSGNPWCD